MQKDTNRGVSRSVLAVVSAAAFLVGIYLGVIISGFTGQQERADRGVPVQESTSGAEQERITALEEAVQENPDDLESWILLGNLYFDKNQPVQAVRAYEHALEFDPDNADVWTDLGVMYRRSGQPKRAVQAFHRAIQIKPGHEIARLNKGIVLFHDLGNREAALEAWRELERINPLAETPTGQSISDLIEAFESEGT